MSEASPPLSTGSGRRRSSITEMFIPRPAAGTYSSSYSPPNASTPMGNTQGNRRGMSITTLGLGGNSPNNQNSPLNAFVKQRRASVASSASGSPEFKNSFEDSAVIEEDPQTGVPTNTPASPSFARRVSFGAQALRDVRSTAAPAGRPPSLFTTLHEQPENESPRNDVSSNNSKATTRGGSRGLSLSRSLRRYNVSCLNFPADNVSLFCIRHTDHLIGEGFNWSEALRDRTRRQPSVSASGNPFQARQRATSISTMEPPKEMPKAHAPPLTAKLGKPDPLGERMLRGDFMMD